ncbi:MAG: hypothetical protein PHI58_00005, partial [Candidatus Omnitrophica bacterium]|nr:hypothetical protein [Candidatus Omnitrophota bacterium]
MPNFICHTGIKKAASFAALQLFLILSIPCGFSEEQFKLPAPALQVHPFRTFGTARPESSLYAINPPDGLAFTADGLLLATDAMNHRVQILDPYSGKHVGSIGGPAIFTGEVVDIAVLSDKGLLISDEKANQIYRFRRTSDSPAKFDYMPPPLLKDEGYKKLCGLACDSKGRIYVVDGITGDVRRYLAD